VKCPLCRVRNLVSIELTIRDEPVVLRSCSHCELRSWEGLDGRLGLDAVLDLAAGR
jgi:hypothetical protein